MFHFRESKNNPRCSHTSQTSERCSLKIEHLPTMGFIFGLHMSQKWAMDKAHVAFWWWSTQRLEASLKASPAFWSPPSLSHRRQCLLSTLLVCCKVEEDLSSAQANEWAATEAHISRARISLRANDILQCTWSEGLTGRIRERAMQHCDCCVIKGWWLEDSCIASNIRTKQRLWTVMSNTSDTKRAELKIRAVMTFRQ